MIFLIEKYLLIQNLAMDNQKNKLKEFFGNVIVHFKGESTKKDKAYVKDFYDAMKIFVDKHYKRFSSYFLKAAISGGAVLSRLKNNSKQLSKSIKQHNVFVLCGDDAAIQSAAAILSARNYNFKITGTNKLSGNLNFSQPANIVFCLHHLTYSN